MALNITDKKLKQLDRWLKMHNEWKQSSWFSPKKWNIRFIAGTYFPYWVQRFFDKTDELPISNLQYIGMALIRHIRHIYAKRR